MVTKKRINRINSFINEPVKIQKNVLKSLLKKQRIQNGERNINMIL